MRLTAPTITGSAWLNTPPLHRDIFYGRVTAVVFWSIQCESSARLLAMLEDHQRSAGPGLAVIAVHSPRFADQTDEATVRTHVEQLRLRVPVVHDPTLTTWGLYDPPGWPSIMLIDHDGRVIGSLAGAPDEVITEAIDTARANARNAQAKKGRVPRPLPIPETPSIAADHTLRYPTGVTELDSTTLAVVDSGNNRVIIGSFEAGANPTLNVQTTIDGFDRPARVVALDANTLAVSEPVNGRVMLVSTGFEPAIWPLDLTDLDTPLKRPVGLTIDRDGSLVIADAGADRLIRVVDAGLDTQTAGRIAGSGVSGSRDGRARRAELSQPVAVAATDAGLAFCELSSSRLRLLTNASKVLTSSSHSGDVGLVDGPLHRALFDRPSGLVSLTDGSLMVIEQGSGRLRSVHGRKVTTFGLEAMASPNDLASPDGDLVVVADTFNHRLIAVERGAKRATPVEMIGLVPRVTVFDFGSPSSDEDFSLFGGDVPDVELQSVPVVEIETASRTIVGTSESSMAVGFPALGSGPWRIMVTAEPSSLIEAPATVTRTSADDPVSVVAKKPGIGTLVIMVSGSDDGQRAVERRSVEIRASDSSVETNKKRSANPS